MCIIRADLYQYAGVDKVCRLMNLLFCKRRSLLTSCAFFCIGYQEISHSFMSFFVGLSLFSQRIPTLVHNCCAEKMREEANLLLHVAIWSQIAAMNVLMSGSQGLRSMLDEVFSTNMLYGFFAFLLFNNQAIVFAGLLYCKFRLRNAFIQLG